jgi:hypothetical protein
MNGFLGWILTEALDRFTQGQGGGGQIPPSTTTATEEGATARTTTSLTSAADLSATGSRVQLTLHWTWQMKTVDKASGASLVEMVDDRTLKGAIDVCPNPAGIMAASLSADQQFTSTGTGGTRSRRDVRNNTFSGHVDDQAVLRSVTQELKDESSWQSSSGDRGSFNVSASQGWRGDAFNSTEGAAQLSYGLKGDAKDADVVNLLTLSNGLDHLTIQDAIQEAQRLWRHGRCVMVTAPDYKAETPIAVADQEKMQHDEGVDPKSNTKFGTGLRHRFGGALNQPVSASLISGDKKLEPGHLEAVPAKLSYTAPDERDKKATVQLKSVSKRGIGTLVLGFHTKARLLQLEIKGEISVAGQCGSTETVAVGPATFRRVDDNQWGVSAAASGTFRLRGGCHAAITPLESCLFEKQWDMTGAVIAFTATMEMRGDTSVWVVQADYEHSVPGSIQTTPAGCHAYVNKFALVSDVDAFFDSEDFTITIPIDGAVIPVHKSLTFDGVVTAEATITAKVIDE